MQRGIKVASSEILASLKKKNSEVESPCHILGVSKFDVARIGAFSFCRGGMFSSVTVIGRFCSMAPDVVVGPEEHKTSVLTTSTFLNSNQWDSDERDAYLARNTKEVNAFLSCIRSVDTRNRKTVSIGNDVWIGQGAIIRKGVTIGDGAVIGANSVVSKNVQPYEIVTGVPAEPLRLRFSEETIVDLCVAKWWDFSLRSLDGIEWAQPEKAARELRRRREAGLFEEASYPTLSY